MMRRKQSPIPSRRRRLPAEPILNIAILRLLNMARNNDFEPLLRDPSLEVRFVSPEADWEGPDALLLPGGSKTSDDMVLLHQCGTTARLKEYVQRGGVVMGICGGYQMLGHRLYDPDGVDGSTVEVEGLGLLPIETHFVREKMLCDTTVRGLVPELEGVLLRGREGRYGRSTVLTPNSHFLDLHTVVERTSRELREEEGLRDGLVREDRRVWGTYLHRIYENRAWTDMFFGFLRSLR